MEILCQFSSPTDYLRTIITATVQRRVQWNTVLGGNVTLAKERRLLLPHESGVVWKSVRSGNPSTFPPMEHSRFLLHKASIPPSSCWARNERCGTWNLWPQFRGKLISRLVPQPLARQAWGRCLAVSMKTIYSALAAWQLAGFSVWVVSHSSSPLPR